MAQFNVPGVPELDPATVKIPSATPTWFLDAWRFEATGPKPPSGFPVIVMAHGIGCNKLMNLKPFAQAFAAQGFAVICFDFRRWGASDGTRRNCIYISERLEDYRIVVKYCRQQEDFNPEKVVLWGYSFAGGHCLSLAAEAELSVAAAILQSPYTGRTFRSRWDHPMFFQLILYAVCPAGIGGDAFDFTKSGVKDFPNQPRATASRITCPVLFIAPRRDSVCPFQATLDTSREIPTAEVLEVSGDHFDMFPGGVDYGPTLKRELEFLKRHLIE